MLFKFKEKPVEITAFISEEYYYVKDYSPIARASTFIPNWYKNMPHSKYNWTENGYELETPRAKSCLGIVTTFQNGYIVPMWCDLAIQVSENMMRYQFSDNIGSIDVHQNSQLPNFYDNHMFCKLISPWAFRISEDIKIIISDTTFFTNNKRDFVIPTAINQTMNKCMSGNLFVFIESLPKNIFIRQGEPLIHYIPLTEKKTNLKLEIVSKQEFFNISPGSPKIKFLQDSFAKLKILRKKLQHK